MKTLMMIMFLLPLTCPAKTMYKCSSGNRVDYQYKPCTGSASEEIIEDQPPGDELIKSDEETKDGIKIGEFSIREDGVNSIGYMSFAYKVQVYNRSNQARNVFLTYKAIDSSGFEIETVHPSGEIQPLSYQDLTGTYTIKAGDYAKISKWVLDK